MRTCGLLGIGACALALSACVSTPAQSAARQSSPALASTTAPLPLIPMPAHVARSPGHFTLRQGATLLVRSDNARAQAIAHRFAALLARTRGIHLDVRVFDGTAVGDGNIVFSLDHADRQAPAGEGYQLTVESDRIHVVARTAAGLFYGGVTLWQLLTPEGAHGLPMQVPDLRIADHPRFAWRGLMLDSVRHVQSVAHIKRLIDWMSLHKLNVLHWHLTDTRAGACRSSAIRNSPPSAPAARQSVRTLH